MPYTHPICLLTEVAARKWEILHRLMRHDQFDRCTQNLSLPALYNIGLQQILISEYIFSREVYLKFGFYDYPLAWNSDDRAWLDFSDGKPIFSINDSFVYFRLSTINVSGRKDNLRLKNKSEIAFYKFMVYEKLKYYNKEQKLRLLRRYQAEIREYKSMGIRDFFTLLYFYLKYLNTDWIKKFFKKVLKKIVSKS